MAPRTNPFTVASWATTPPLGSQNPSGGFRRYGLSVRAHFWPAHLLKGIRIFLEAFLPNPPIIFDIISLLFMKLVDQSFWPQPPAFIIHTNLPLEMLISSAFKCANFKKFFLVLSFKKSLVYAAVLESFLCTRESPTHGVDLWKCDPCAKLFGQNQKPVVERLTTFPKCNLLSNAVLIYNCNLI